MQTAQQDALRKLKHKDKRRQTALQRVGDRKKKGKKKGKGRRAAATSSSEEREDSDSESGREDERQKTDTSADGRSQDDEDDEISGEDPEWDKEKRRKRKRRAPATGKNSATVLQALLPRNESVFLLRVWCVVLSGLLVLVALQDLPVLEIFLVANILCRRE